MSRDWGLGLEFKILASGLGIGARGLSERAQGLMNRIKRNFAYIGISWHIEIRSSSVSGVLGV